MSILTSASSSSVYRGYEYNKLKRVEKVQQLNDYEYEGYVQGSLKTPYYVKININSDYTDINSIDIKIGTARVWWK